ncbi:hypothetical protein TGME49_256975 [Toxoplasma gondii ME49]|uniref:Uncharacterized protein n=4 Tax=Toxoplasma gondii TaxID=5811 RepID=A0A125YXB0_TOXGV|nr:hypothetical protein TGME49_256975 [Toxoplasma gondii ME49]EPT29228.1 hypothetical protein TGME49_256975 [Toxoplasma gondii ME49]ESS28629.1 hypothetical protein TGVEG_256975 [Toxoplasma gondii VEG]KYF45758.1 hypothetical protein TGARI_256975 [Toxoplasma gondii ARI]PIM03604.1 hypothetical protein TGCOUG_256975 [Toxoplasma gondii COUG]|eukprot:XP_018636962.1 hypothetical protein TGME49_256975 [Toxoplasma gondii ME49]
MLRRRSGLRESKDLSYSWSSRGSETPTYGSDKDGQSIGWNSTFVGADLPSFAEKLSALLCLPHSRFFDACCLHGAHVCVDPFVCSNKANACRFL